jgi:hypothetical protein
LTSTAIRPESGASSGLPARTFSTSRVAISSGVPMGSSEIPGSPWMPRPMAMFPGVTVNKGSVSPGRVQPAKAMPIERVTSLT